MRANDLVIIFPTKGLPQNTEQACGAVWAEASRLLLPGMGKWYTAFYPAVRPWGIKIRTPFGVVLGREKPVCFLRLYFQGRNIRKDSIAFHVAETIAENGVDKLHPVGDILLCPVALDGTNKRLESHIFWHMAISEGVLLPDCGVYYAERKRSLVELGLEKVIESSPADYALCAVTLEYGED